MYAIVVDKQRIPLQSCMCSTAAFHRISQEWAKFLSACDWFLVQFHDASCQRSWLVCCPMMSTQLSTVITFEVTQFSEMYQKELQCCQSMDQAESVVILASL